MEFELIDIDALARIGRINLNNKELITPNLLPVIHPIESIISAKDLAKMGVNGLFTNAFIIYQNAKTRNEVIKKGIHEFLKYDGIIATDSGAFQQYMYAPKNIKIDANEIENFQQEIGSDLPVILDEPVQLDNDYRTAKEKIILTINRAKENIKRRENLNCHWIGPIHGGKYFDLLKKCTIAMNKLNFNIYAIGGLVKPFLDYRFKLTLKILLTVRKFLAPENPLHMFGAGLPQFFSLAVACGCDLMDSAAYILYAKENRYFSLSTGTKKLEALNEFPCHCPICLNYTPKELKSFENNKRIELLSKHNLYTSFSELKSIRQAIREGNLWELVEQRIRNHPNLVKAARYIGKNHTFFEVYEKIYKNHGRLFSSLESLNRPIIYRYNYRISKNYRVPKNVKYLIILPELDVKGVNSPSTTEWLKKIDTNKKIKRERIHIVFFSEIFGIIPYELIDTFPLGQYESVNFSDIVHPDSLKYCINYFNNHSKNYYKCAVLIPEIYINQFNEIKKFPHKNPIKKLKKIIEPLYNLKILIFQNIDAILNSFE